MKFENTVFVFTGDNLLAVVERGTPEADAWDARQSEQRGDPIRFGGAGFENKDFNPPGGMYGFLLAELIAFAERGRNRYEDVIEQLMAVDEFRALFRHVVAYEPI